jgi:hypothetical protein
MARSSLPGDDEDKINVIEIDRGVDAAFYASELQKIVNALRMHDPHQAGKRAKLIGKIGSLEKRVSGLLDLAKHDLGRVRSNAPKGAIPKDHQTVLQKPWRSARGRGRVAL